jgi:hypothetical protein
MMIPVSMMSTEVLGLDDDYDSISEHSMQALLQTNQMGDPISVDVISDDD